MPAWTSQPRSCPSLIRKSSLGVAAAGLLLTGAGCRRAPEDSIRYSSGYVQLDNLVQRHPGWQDVKQLDAMIAHVSNLPGPPRGGRVPLPQAALPKTLQRQPLLPAAIAAEKKRIEAVQFPARTRVERLRASSDVRIDRAVDAREKELRSITDAELRQAEADINEESRRERIGIDSQWYVTIRDLWLKEFALESQVATYRPYPASPAYKISAERLAEIRAQRQKAEQQLALELEGAGTRLQQKLASARSEIEARFTGQIADYRNELERRAAQEMGQRLAAMQAVLTSLEPLERPKVPRAVETAGMTIPSPEQIASSSPPAASPAIETAAQIAALKAQRERLAAYLQKDVKRRLDRLATQHRWRLAYGPRPGLDNITDTAAGLLVEEWTP